jgi:two-component system, OmpR family, response regulator
MAALRVLIVEDEPAARAQLVKILEDDGYQVLAVSDGQAALEAAKDFAPDLALVDGALPGSNGVEVARGLRQSSDLPIIFVTGADSAQDIHDGFRMGADDYILKPFDPEELSWRVRAVLRRSGHTVAQRMECGDLVVDEATHFASRAGAALSLTATEFTILGVLIRNRTRVVPKGQLLAQVWGYDADDHLVEVHVSSLRRKLEAHGPRMIQTIRGTGYVLAP